MPSTYHFVTTTEKLGSSSNVYMNAEKNLNISKDI
jgi:hypothetical protein